MTIRVIGRVDENHRLWAEVPESVSAGPVKVIIEVSKGDEEPDSDAWAAMVSEAWAEDLSDVTQDIYTMEDGEPVDERR
ncbi:MAG TPA: hypothetical protein VIM11_21845 [Tepidisphaeraceae bacterium]|jgi:hypothetical protein